MSLDGLSASATAAAVASACSRSDPLRMGSQAVEVVIFVLSAADAAEGGRLPAAALIGVGGGRARVLHQTAVGPAKVAPGEVPERLGLHVEPLLPGLEGLLHVGLLCRARCRRGETLQSPRQQ